MAFVILSAGSLTQSRTYTLCSKVVTGCVLVATLVLLGGGFALGYSMSGATLPVEEHAVTAPAAIVAIELEPSSDNRLLIDRFGELSGRMIQLEMEATELAARIGAIQEFESRIKQDDEPTAKGRIARTPPGGPAGGPLLRPDDATPGDTSWLGGELPEAAPLTDELARMEENIARLAGGLAELDRIATSLNLAHMSFPGRAPVPGIDVTSSFGNRLDPFTKRRAFHSGVDFPAPRGTEILASAGGRVIFAGTRPAYGRTVEIDHGAGLVTRYAHASKLHVKLGQVVMPGELIAEIGSTGRSTGPHLHFEILKDGRFVDPKLYLARF